MLIIAPTVCFNDASADHKAMAACETHKVKKATIASRLFNHFTRLSVTSA